MYFPINFERFRGLPINRHPGAFGCPRKYDIHTGVDLYLDKESGVYAIEEGIVAKYDLFTGGEKMPWWNTTYALSVKGENCFWVYGEIESDLRIGDKVKRGQKVGEVLPVISKDKIRLDIPGHSNYMLHLEKCDLSWETECKDLQWSGWYYNNSKPRYLLDPTQDLINVLVKYHRLTFL